MTTTSPRSLLETETAAPHQASFGESLRELVDFGVWVLMLLFLLKAFAAEAFVIPTGSMAPTLVGVHKDLRCANCGTIYQVEASGEQPNELPGAGRPATAPHESDGSAVVASTCPVCRFTMPLLPPPREQPVNEREGLYATEPYPTFAGDRIVVARSAYALGDPQRWDVVVFKFPAEASTNFIKRLVGLPGETVIVKHGDIYVRRSEELDFEIARKDPPQALAMLQRVHDQDALAQDALTKAGWPSAWQDAGAATDLRWESLNDNTAFQVQALDGQARLRFGHRPPTYGDWLAFGEGRPVDQLARPPQLVTDFTSYNTNYPPEGRGPRYRTQEVEADPEALGLHWANDLAVEFEVDIAEARGTLQIELIEGGKQLTCRIDLRSGLAALGVEGAEDYRPTGQTSLHRLDRHQVRFANIDDQLLLWIDGRLVEFHTTTAYGPLDNAAPTAEDLYPISIQAEDARFRVSHLVVARDVYYTAISTESLSLNDWIHDYADNPLALVQAEPDIGDGERLARLMSSPHLWPSLMQMRRAVQFSLGPEQYFVLGDNSPRSKDGRLWGVNRVHGIPEYVVPRDVLLGRAVFVYWPHSWHRTSRDGGTWFPFFPNVERMRLIR